MSDLQNMIEAVIKFRDERDWQRFTNIKDTAIAISLEAAEVLDHVKWKTDKEMEVYVKKHKTEIAEELSDVMFNVLLMTAVLDIDLAKTFTEKMKKNRKKYPIAKVKGKNQHLY